MIENKKLSDEEFSQQRKEVLSMWHTGEHIDLDEAIEYNKSLPSEKNFVRRIRRAASCGEILATTGMGKSTVVEQIELLQHVENEGDAEILAISPDSMTRFNKFDEVQKHLEESIKTKRSKLNGLPVVNVGVSGIRQIVESVKSPIALRGGMVDGRLLSETLFAGGCVSYGPDWGMNFWQHSATAPYDYVVQSHQYIGRLMGLYEEQGIPVMAGVQGLYGAGIPPSLQSANIVISAILLTEQGVKNLNIKCVGNGNLAQDVASSSARESVLRYYLDKFEYNDVVMSKNLSFSLMSYPAEVASSLAVIFMNTLMARLIGATISDIRTMAEAKAIPTKENIADTLKIAKVMQNYLQHQEVEVPKEELELQIQMEEKEIKAIIDKVLEFGDGDILIGAAKAIEVGVLDNPFAANRAAVGKVLGVKDNKGAIRYYDTGNLPFSKEIVDYHKEKIAERESKRGIKVGYDTIIDDLFAVSRGYLV